MTQDEKKLLLRDLSARLPYGVKGRVWRNDHNNRKCEFVATIDGKLYDRFAVFQESWYDNVTIKPYLFPLSSMTEEQKTYINDRWGVNENFDFDIDNHNHSHINGSMFLSISLDGNSCTFINDDPTSTKGNYSKISGYNFYDSS